MDGMSEESPAGRLAQIRAREQAATEGSWFVGREGDVVAPGDQCVAEVWPLGAGPDVNARFIAGARQDVPWLLGQLETAQAAMECVRQIHVTEIGNEWGDLECGVCRHPWPCPTIAALEGRGAPDLHGLRQKIADIGAERASLPADERLRLEAADAPMLRIQLLHMLDRVERAETGRDAARVAMPVEDAGG